MKKIIKPLIFGGIFVCIGLILLIVALSLNGWSLKVNIKFDTVTYECQSDTVNINVEVDAGTVRCEFYEGDKISVEIPTAKGFTYTARENNGTLIFKSPRCRWYANWFLSYNIPDTVIRIPEGKVLNVKLDIDAGSAYLADGTYGSVNVEIDAGSFKGENITCNTLKVNVDAGSVKIASADCASFVCDVDAGSVSVDALNTQSANLDVDAGSVSIGFTGKEEDYTITKRVRAGSCNLNNRVNTEPNSKTINVDVSAGKVTASFLG